MTIPFRSKLLIGMDCVVLSYDTFHFKDRAWYYPDFWILLTSLTCDSVQKAT